MDKALSWCAGGLGLIPAIICYMFDLEPDQTSTRTTFYLRKFIWNPFIQKIFCLHLPLRKKMLELERFVSSVRLHLDSFLSKQMNLLGSMLFDAVHSLTLCPKKIFGRTRCRTPDSRLRSTDATSVLCCPSNKSHLKPRALFIKNPYCRIFLSI